MREDLKYRLVTRNRHTSLGRPLYERMNVQVVLTQECPYSCPFCLERKHPMKGQFDREAQLRSLQKVLCEHPDARLTIIGGEPGLYPDHVKKLVELFRTESNNIFVSINTAGYSTQLNGIAHINLSVNDYVKPNPEMFLGCTLQTVIEDKDMCLNTIKDIMNRNKEVDSFSFRFLCGMDKDNYNVTIWNELQDCPDVDVRTFRVGDFFVYATFNLEGKHARVTLGDMNQQSQNNYMDGYSNVVIHPDGRVGTNWR